MDANNKLSSSPRGSTITSPSSHYHAIQMEKLHALELKDAHTAQRIIQLEAIINDTTLGVVPRTKAKVELALLKKDENNQFKDEIAQIKQGIAKDIALGIESATEDRLQYELTLQNQSQDMYNLAMKQRDEARTQLTNHKLAENKAEEALRSAEKEAELAIQSVKVAMNKLYEAQKEYAYEKKLYEEARAIEAGHVVEMNRLDVELEKKGDSMEEEEEEEGTFYDATAEAGGAIGIGGDHLRDLIKQFSVELNAMGATFDAPGEGKLFTKKQQEKEPDNRECCKCIELQRKVDILQGKLKETRKVADLAQTKVISLEEYVSDSASKEVYWKEQSAKLSKTLQDMQDEKTTQEAQLHDLKTKISIEDNQMAKLRGEIEELKGMKLIILEEERQKAKEEAKDSQLESLSHEIMTLISDKEDALETVSKVKEQFETMLVQHESTIQDLQCDLDTYQMELQDAKAKLDNKTKETSNLQSSMDTLQETINDKEDTLESVLQVKERFEMMLAQREVEIRKLQRDLDSSVKDLQYAQTQLDIKTQEVSNLQLSMDSLQKELEQKSEEMAEQEEMIAEQRKTIKKLKRLKKEAMIIQQQ